MAAGGGTDVLRPRDRKYWRILGNSAYRSTADEKCSPGAFRVLTPDEHEVIKHITEPNSRNRHCPRGSPLVLRTNSRNQHLSNPRGPRLSRALFPLLR